MFLGEGTQPFDFIKRNILRKSAYKVKYIIQINRGLMFFGNWGIRFFLKSWLDCEQYGNNTKKKIKKEYNQHSLMFKMLR